MKCLLMFTIYYGTHSDTADIWRPETAEKPQHSTSKVGSYFKNPENFSKYV